MPDRPNLIERVVCHAGDSPAHRPMQRSRPNGAAVLTDCSRLRDGLGMQVSPRQGKQGDDGIERAFAEK